MSGCIMAWYSSTLSVAFSDPTATVTTAMLCCVLSSTAALNTEGMMSSTPGSTGPWSLTEGLNPGSVSGEQDWSRSHGKSGLYSSHQSSGSSLDNAISTRDFTATKLLFFYESRLQVAKDMSNKNQKHSSYFAIMLSFFIIPSCLSLFSTFSKVYIRKWSHFSASTRKWLQTAHIFPKQNIGHIHTVGQFFHCHHGF